MLPSPPPEVPASADVSKIAPRFRAAVLRALDNMRTAGFDPSISEALRTNERQRFLYGFGRAYDDAEPRGVVTNSINAMHTWHGFGLAVDVISKSRQWDAPTAFWSALRACAEQEGLVSGGAWVHLTDRPHVQWGAPMRRSPSPHAAELFASGGLPAVWREVGAE